VLCLLRDAGRPRSVDNEETHAINVPNHAPILLGAIWQDRYTAQMLHVWVVPYPGGVFSDDLSAAATNAAVQAVLAEHS
jgi:hypothetical protein